MEPLQEYIAAIQNSEHRVRVEEVLNWVQHKFENLLPRIAWNQPMFTDHGTFIIGFSVSKQHVAVAPERAGMVRFSDDIKLSGYTQGKMLFRIPWDMQVDYPLLEKIIAFNIEDKADCNTFWRK